MSTRLDALVRKSLFNVYFGWIQIEFTQCFVVIIYIYISHSDSRSTVVLQSEILETMYVSYAHKVHNKSVEKIDA